MCHNFWAIKPAHIQIIELLLKIKTDIQFEDCITVVATSLNKYISIAILVCCQKQKVIHRITLAKLRKYHIFYKDPIIFSESAEDVDAGLISRNIVRAHAPRYCQKFFC